jgi:ABC-type polysaccharide/polyol phosphate transport system, ATPase component
MSDTVISVEHLSKRYRLGVINTGTFRDDLKIWFAQKRGKPNPLSKVGEVDYGNREEDILWALRDVNFTVQRGEALGIIGRNGAGKSTLLKILSRVTSPTQGHVHVKGRIASLLEVGTGFHPELTGRENIYLNGAIMGMNRAEVTRKFDEIVDFSGVEKFIDTPVKRYSSGMYVRLAFAVAAHLEPEILIVDEVLAVGDAEFQKKCLGKMGQVASEGRTVLFVSHNMAAIQNLCKTGMVMRNGRIQMIGTETEAVAAYLSSFGENQTSLLLRDDHYGSGQVKIDSIYFVDREGKPIDSAVSGQEIGIRMHFIRNGVGDYPRLNVSIGVHTQMDVPIFLQHNRLTKHFFGPLPKEGVFELRIPKLPLPPGMYRVDYSLLDGNDYIDSLSNAIELTVGEGDFFGSGEVPPLTHGVSLVEGVWKLEKIK